MLPDEHTNETHNPAPEPDSSSPRANEHRHSQGRNSNEDHHDDTDNQRHSIFSLGSSDEDEGSSKGSHRSAATKPSHAYLPLDKHVAGSSNDNKNSNVLGDPDHHGHSQTHVHFKERFSVQPPHPPPVPPLTNPPSQESDEPQDDLARASWTTASFTEVPNALDELTKQHHLSRTSTKEPEHPQEHGHHENEHMHLLHHSTEHKPQKPEKSDIKQAPIERSSATDLHSILIKQAKESHASILTKYLRPTMSDEGTQAGIPSWDWLTRLEQMLIHFFLMVFESSSDSSRLIMEMMSTEAGTQIEEIFQLLLKAEPDMYKELGHLVSLAEKWLIHWKGDSEERQKAIEYVRLYMRGVKDKNYYMLPVQVRLHKLGAFIAGLNVMGKDGFDSGKFPPIRYPVYKAHKSPSAPIKQIRLNSPRVKPATHFSQVVANILCGRPCNDPLPKADVYADNLGRKVFKDTLHGDKEFKEYTDVKYGNLYKKEELFSKEFPRVDSLGAEFGAGDIEGLLPGRDECVENLHCWIPKYTKSYVNKLEGEGCEVLAKADHERGKAIKDFRLAVGSEDDGTGKKIKAFKAKKLYDWVRGPDGKVHRRVVGSYTELGTAAGGAHGRGGSRPNSGGARGGGGGGGMNAKYGKKGMMRGPGYPKAVSDTRLGGRNTSYDTKKSQTIRASKGRFTSTSREREGVGKYAPARKSKLIASALKPAADSYRADVMSVAESGDSGHDNEMTRKDKRGDDGNKKREKSMLERRATEKFGKNYHGPSNYKPHPHDSHTHRDSQGTKRSSGYRDQEFKPNGLVSIFGKSDHTHASSHKASAHGRHDKLFDKKGHRRYKTMDHDEWEGEGYHPDWSPRSSDYFNYDNEEPNNKQENLQLLSINHCWEKASKLLKKPSKALVIPPAENLMLYLEKKYPKYRWAKGDPIATRNYPNGSTFVAQYRNGASKVFYPHGGLAAVISARSPVTSQILVVRDPSDHVFFFDKALLAELNSSGKGAIYGDDGVIQAQYSAIGGFKLDNLEKGQRWQWNQGGQRMLLKLNKYMSLRISDLDKIYLNFFGNQRGFLVNVASGHEVILMNPTSKTRVDPIIHELKHLIRPKTKEDHFDYIRGKFNLPPTLGFVDKAKHYASLLESLEQVKNQEDSPGDGDKTDVCDILQGNYYDCRQNCSDTFPDCTMTNGGDILVHTLPVATYNSMC